MTFFISNLGDQREVQRSSAVLYITYINRLRIFRIVTFPVFGSSLSARLPPHLFQHFIDDAPIDKLFERSCELGLWRLTADKIGAIFGTRVNRRHRGKLATVIEQIEHGHHVFRAYFKSAVLRQYEKFSTFLRNELCSNNLTDFGLRKGLDHLPTVRETFQAITGRFAGFQAQWLNVHVDFPLLQRIALPITIGPSVSSRI